MTKSKHIQPSATLLLNLAKSEEEILSSMHPKTRYNIRLAERHGVTVKESNNVDEFLTLNRETKARDKFKSHSDEYYRKMLKALMTNAPARHASQGDAGGSSLTPHACHAKLFTAYYKGQPLASNIVIFFRGTATYLHGASSDEHRNVMASHLLQWEQIKHAKEQGYKWYDFWGIMPKEQVNSVEHSNYNANYGSNFDANFKAEQYRGWEGITRFKRGFVSETTGKEVSYPSCFDLPISRFWYTLYKGVKLFRR